MNGEFTVLDCDEILPWMYSKTVRGRLKFFLFKKIRVFERFCGFIRMNGLGLGFVKLFTIIFCSSYSFRPKIHPPAVQNITPFIFFCWRSFSN